MNNINWVQVVIGFLTGGAFGALIKQYFDNRRNKIQPIGHSIEIKSFYNSVNTKLLNSQITISENNQEYKFTNLYTGTIQLLNTGLNDYTDFSFGITLPDHSKIIQIKSNTTDRHHLTELNNVPSLSNPLNTLDISLKPFNRKDRYSFDILLSTSNTYIDVSSIQISTSKPIKWVALMSTGEAILEIANKTLLEVFTTSIVRMLKV